MIGHRGIDLLTGFEVELELVIIRRYRVETTTTRPEVVGRSYRDEEDLQAICDLINHINELEDLDDSRSVSDLSIEITGPWIDSSRDIRLWEDADGRLVGLGWMWMPRDDGVAVEGRLY